MDQGAHFYNCDLQVHTPRDTNWHGDRAETKEERAKYARELVAACRAAGLGAIAITDHHDLSFFPYVREAAADERGERGEPYPDRLVVFPGMELTLAVPCQALLILDADFPEDQLATVGAALAITPVAIDEPLGSVEPLDIHTFSALYETLDRHSVLKGRYVVLPNVSQSGRHTLLRSGFSEKYKEMPCVGGYLDGLIAQHAAGAKKIVAGKDVNYGNKRLACYQTSDNRHRDHSQLAKATTWVKWSAPTAEAIRQASLAQETRLSHTAPILPITFISRLSVSNSLFLGPVELELNRQYNAFIGGRGTGKSTILEYLRWALCDVAEEVVPGARVPGSTEPRENIIEATLGVMPSAEVEVHFQVNDLPHVVRRNAESGEITLKVGDDDFRRVSEADVRSIIPIQAFSQKQLSAVSGRVNELDRFVTTPIQAQLNELDREQEGLTAEIRAAYGRVQRYRTLEGTIRQDELGESSLRSQAEKLREGLTGIGAEDQLLLGQRSAHDAARLVVAKFDRALTRAKEASAEYQEALTGLVDVVKEPVGDVPEAQTIMEMQTALAQALESALEAAQGVEQKLTQVGADGSEYVAARSHWQTVSSELDAQYEAATARWTAHEQRLGELADVETRQRALAEAVAIAKEQLNGLGDPQGDYETLRTQWVALRSERLRVMSEQCDHLTELSEEEIRAEMNPNSTLPELAQALKRVVSGSNVRGTRIDDFVQALGENPDPLGHLEEVLKELERVAIFDPSDKLASVPASPSLLGLGLPQADVERVAGHLSPDVWLELSLTPLNPKPAFFYRSKESRYIVFRNASAGQQATALLHVLLNQSGPPLVIDQPEDDLDNEVIPKVVEQIWAAKTRRQLIFTSHDANLVVNGDADLVVCCANRVAGDHSAGQIAYQGAIDIPDVREAITRVMEGGERAFRLRTAKYGF